MLEQNIGPDDEAGTYFGSCLRYEREFGWKWWSHCSYPVGEVIVEPAQPSDSVQNADFEKKTANKGLRSIVHRTSTHRPCQNYSLSIFCAVNDGKARP